MRHEQHGASLMVFRNEGRFNPLAIQAVKSDSDRQGAPAISKELQKKLRSEAEAWAEKKAKELEELLKPKEED